MITELPVTAVTADEVQQELIAKIRGYFPDWTDNQASNNMIMLLETLSALSELEFAYVNRLADLLWVLARVAEQAEHVAPTKLHG